MPCGSCGIKAQTGAKERPVVEVNRAQPPIAYRDYEPMRLSLRSLPQRGH